MNILITGGKNGFMLRVAQHLAINNKIFLTVHTTESIPMLKEKVNNYKNITIFRLNINNPMDREHIKDLDIDVLINNAAIGLCYSLVDMPVEELRKIYETNIFSTLELTQLILRKMIAKNSGKIVFISSQSGTFPFPFLSAYASAKSSLSYIAKCMDKELKSINKNVNIKLIELGAYSTGFNQKMYRQLKHTPSKYFDYKKVYHDLNHLFLLIEYKNLNTAIDTILKAVLCNNKKILYRAPLMSSIVVKIYSIFK